MSRTFAIAGLVIAMSLGPMLSPCPADEPDPVPQDLLERVMNTVAFRFEQAEALAEQGKTAEAEAAYQELIDLHELADPLAAQTWLRLASLRAGRGDRAGARALYLEIRDRFSHIPWAITEADAALDGLSGDGGTAPSGRDPFQTNQPSSAAIVSGDRLISIDMKEADLNNVTALFSKLLEVTLDIDPALADRRVTIRARNIPLREAIHQVAAQTGTRVVRTLKGYRLVAKSSRAEPDPGPAVGDIEGGKGLDREAFAKVVRARWNDLTLCFKDQPQTETPRTVRLSLAFSVVPSGSVDFAYVVPERSTALPVQVRQCIEGIISSWRFPRFQSGSVYTMQEIQLRLGQP